MEYKTNDGETRSELEESHSVFKQSSNSRPNTIGFFSLADYIWRGKWTVLLLTFLGFVTALFMASTVSFLQYSKHYEYIVQLTFSGVENKTYPNGTPFSIGDITAPAILIEIYKKNKISETGITYQEFADLISITPYAPNRQLILSSYRSIFNKRKASLAELEEAQKNMDQKLKNDARRAAVLRFKVFGDKLSQSQVSFILADIVTRWSTKAVNEKGVTQANIQSVSTAEIEEAEFAGYSGLDLLSALVVRFNSLNDYVAKLAPLPGAHRATDPDTGNSINYLSDQMKDIWRSIKKYPVNWTLDEAQLANVQISNTGLYSYNSFSDVEHISSDLQFLDLINNKRALVAANAKLLLSMRFGATVLDSAGGITALDISQTINEMKQFDLENLRTLIITNSRGPEKKANIDYIKIKLGRLNRELQLENKNSQILTDAQNAYNSEVQNTNSSNKLDNEGASIGSDLISPQLSGGFIDRLIALNERSGDREFREKLVDETIRHRTNAAKLSTEANQVRSDLAILQSNESASQNSVIATNDSEIKSRLNGLISRMNEYGRITNKIAARLQLASAITKILKNSNMASDKLNPPIDFLSISQKTPKDSEGLEISNYLRDNNVQTISLPKLIADQKKVTISANSIHQLISEKTFGYNQSLFEPLSGVDLMERSIFRSRWIYIIIALTLIGLLIGIAIIIFRGVRMERNIPISKIAA